MESDKIPLLVILGPTACGKTSLSIRLAKLLNGEIVCADSMQVYDLLEIGTARPVYEEQQGVRHHLFGTVSPFVNFDVSTYIEKAREVIFQIFSSGKLPILVGGTGLYIDLLTSGKKLPETQPDLEYRKKLRAELDSNGVESLYQKLCLTDPEYADKIASADARRIIRALELYHSTGMNMTQHNLNSCRTEKIYKTCFLGINLEKNLLCERIYKRVDNMFKIGLVDETKNILSIGVDKNSNAMQAIGYKQVIAYINGEITLQEAVEKVKTATRQYAKRQRCWFKRNKDVFWIDKPELSDAEVDELAAYVTETLNLRGKTCEF